MLCCDGEILNSDPSKDRLPFLHRSSLQAVDETGRSASTVCPSPLRGFHCCFVSLLIFIVDSGLATYIGMLPWLLQQHWQVKVYRDPLLKMNPSWDTVTGRGAPGYILTLYVLICCLAGLPHSLHPTLSNAISPIVWPWFLRGVYKDPWLVTTWMLFPRARSWYAMTYMRWLVCHDWYDMIPILIFEVIRPLEAPPYRRCTAAWAAWRSRAELPKMWSDCCAIPLKNQGLQTRFIGFAKKSITTNGTMTRQQ